MAHGDGTRGTATKTVTFTKQQGVQANVQVQVTAAASGDRLVSLARRQLADMAEFATVASIA